MTSHEPAIHRWYPLAVCDRLQNQHVILWDFYEMACEGSALRERSAHVAQLSQMSSVERMCIRDETQYGLILTAATIQLSMGNTESPLQTRYDMV